MIYLDAHVGEKFKIGEAVVSVLQKKGRMVRLSVEADQSIGVVRMREAAQKRCESLLTAHQNR